MGDAVLLTPGWWCWLEVPAALPGWGASPVLVEQVEPLKIGNNLLRLRFVQAIHPVAARRREVVLRVLLRAADHLVGTLKEEDGTIRTAILAKPDHGWLATHCPLLLRGRPPVVPSLHIVGKPPPKGPSAAQYLDDTLGRGAEPVLRGATAGSFGKERPPMPAQQGRFELGQTYEPFESWLIARGFVPREMEEKWFIYLEDGRLLFRRSWTGLLIYDAEARWQGDRLRLGEVRVNRDPREYKETDDGRDRALLAYLVRVVLLGGSAPYPDKPGLAPGQAAIEAWSVAGKATL